MKHALVISIVLLVLAACAPTQTATSLPTAVPTAAQNTPTVAPTPTNTPLPTSTATRTLTPTPTLTPIPTIGPTPTLVPKIPLGQRKHPRTLINADDIARMKNWVAKYDWAKNIRDQIVNDAKTWPSKYLSDYNLTKPEVPPTGGYVETDYLCPDNTQVTYVPAHTPPHYCQSLGKYFASPPQWPSIPTVYDQVIYWWRHRDLAQYARNLGLAYQLTGDKTFAEGAAYILRNYALLYPDYPAHIDLLSSPTWTQSAGKVSESTLRESIWVIDLAFGYDLIADSGILSASDLAMINDKVFRLAAAKIKTNNDQITNWQVLHNTALAIIAAVLGDQAQFEEVFYRPTNGFFALVDRGAAGDGFWYEGSWGYHFLSLTYLVYTAEMGARAGLDPYANPNLRNMFSAPLRMAAPDLSLPPFNDSPISSVVSFGSGWAFDAAYNRYRDDRLLPPSTGRTSWLSLMWGSEALPTLASKNIRSSEVLPLAGYVILRAGASEDPRYIALDYGPHGGWHGHYDKLGYVPFALGRYIGTDPATHNYMLPEHDAWDRTTVAHNTVVVDQRKQAEATGRLRRFVGLPALGIASADAGLAYPGRATILRTLALNADYWLDITTVASQDWSSRHFDWVYHNSGSISTSLSQAPYSAFPNTDGYNYLTATKSATTDGDWQAVWGSVGAGSTYGSIWMNKTGLGARSTVTNTVASNGKSSWQLDYNFGATADGYILYTSRNFDTLPDEVPTRISVRIYGDGSNNGLTLRIMDASGEKFGKGYGTINWTGWRTVEMAVDRSWWHQAGNDNGIIDTPISQVVLQVDQRKGGATAGRIFADEITLIFPSAGKQIVEDFDTTAAQLQMIMLGVPNTVVVTGNGIDSTDQPIPFAMARRQGTETTFTAIFEPYRTSPRISTFQAIPVSPTVGSPTAVRIVAPNQYTDTFMIVDENARADRAFGTFSTDATTAYVRYDKTNALQVLVLANATKFSSGTQAIVTSTVPITAQLSFVGDTLAVATQGAFTTQLRVYAPAASKLNINGNSVTMQRDGDYVVFDLTGK